MHIPAHKGTPLVTDVGIRIREQVTALIPLMRKNALEGEHIGAMPQETLVALHKTGAFQLTTPIELGGHALGIRDVVDIVSEMGRGDGAAGWLGFVAGGVRNLLGFPERALQELVETGRDAVGPWAVGASIFATKVGEARRVEGGFMVKGTWHFGSGCKHAPWAAVGVEFVDADGPHRGMVLLERKQYDILDDWNVMGMRGTCSNSLRTPEEVFVPAHRHLDMAELPMRMGALNGRFTGLAYRVDQRGLMMVTNLTNMAVTYGMARGALDCFIDQAQRLKPFNLPYPTIADAASTQMVAAKASAMLELTRVSMQQMAEAVDRAAIDGTGLSPDQDSQMQMNSVWGRQLCDEAASMLQLCLGSSTIGDHNPIQRFVRDIRVANTHGAVRVDPTAEIHGRHLLGRPPFAMFGGGLPDVAARPPGAPAAVPSGTPSAMPQKAPA
jgi:alkylation response protein AidB-like acyl-CoA dehydrogenase